MTARLYRIGPRHDASKLPFSPTETAARIRRAARALQHKVQIDDLRRRGFTIAEINKARAMLEPRG